eukprot:44801-Chlamydomonas_euryale.AAC.2
MAPADHIDAAAAAGPVPDEVDVEGLSAAGYLRWSPSIDWQRLSEVRYVAKGTHALVYTATLAPPAQTHAPSRTLPGDGGGGKACGSCGAGGLPRLVALKVLRPVNLQRPEPRRAFLREVALHADLRHRCACALCACTAQHACEGVCGDGVGPAWAAAWAPKRSAGIAPLKERA